MREFTKEEISLCKQIAEKHRKEIKRRQYFYNSHRGEIQWSGEDGQYLASWVIPLWTISDCLEFLRGKNYDVNLHYFTHRGYWMIQIWNQSNSQAFYSDYGKENKNKTPLEACLKAVLAVVEEE